MFKSNTCLVALLTSVLVLCAGSAFGGGQVEPEAKDVTLRIFARAYTWEQEAPWEVAKAEIQKRHPDTKFTWVEEGFGWADLRAKFLTAAAGGNPPVSQARHRHSCKRPFRPVSISASGTSGLSYSTPPLPS